RPHTSELPTLDGTESSRHVVARPSPPSWPSTSPTPASNYTSPSRAGTRSFCDHSPYVASQPPSFPAPSPLHQTPVSRSDGCTPPFISRWRSSGGAHAISLQPHGRSPSSSAARHALPRLLRRRGAERRRGGDSGTALKRSGKAADLKRSQDALSWREACHLR